MKTQNKYKNVCCVNSAYSLLLYLIYCPDEDIEKTFFFSIGSENIDTSRLACYRIKRDWGRRMWMWIVYRFLKWFKFPHFGKETEYYIKDNNAFFKYIVGDKLFTCIEDSANACSNNYNEVRMKQVEAFRNTFKCKIYRYLYAPTMGEDFGIASNCNRLIVTQYDDSPLLKGKQQIVLPNLDNKLWEELSEYKKEMITTVFCFLPDDIKIMEQKENIILTQPFYKDGYSYEEHVRIYKKILLNYPKGTVAFKLHPRDDSSIYQKEFPNIPCMTTQAPLQVLLMQGVKFKRVITAFSTAINAFPEDVEIHWYGSEISDEIYNKVGHYEPSRLVVYVK